jgi:hypothetical protein
MITVRPPRKRQLAFECAKRTENVVRVVMRRGPLAWRVSVFQDTDTLVFQHELVLVAIGNHRIACGVAQLVKRGRLVGHECSSVFSGREVSHACCSAAERLVAQRRARESAGTEGQSRTFW